MKESFRPIKNVAPAVGTFGKIKFQLRLILDIQNKTIYRDLKKFLLGTNGTVLDIGCGDGPYKHLLSKKCKYIGLDIENHENFDYKNKGILLFNGYDIPLRNESVDYFFCTEVLEHVEYPEKLVNDIYRVLKSDGEGIVTVPFSARYHYIPFDYFRYTPTALRSILNKFSNITIKNRGTDISTICSKIIVLSFRNLFPNKLYKVVLFPLALVLFLPLLFLATLVAHLSLIFNIGSDNDPLGYTVYVKK